MIACHCRYPITICVLSHRGKLNGPFVMYPLLLRYMILRSLYRNNKGLFIFYYKTAYVIYQKVYNILFIFGPFEKY